MAKAALTESHPGTSLCAMLEARSVAVVGASPRNGSFGAQMMLQLTAGGFDGAIHPVNPRYADVMGYRCLPSIADVPEPVDLAILGVSNAMLEEQVRAAAKAGARSAVIFASCYERPRPGRPTLADRLTTIAREAGMSLCGGNGMGFINVDRRLRACGFSEPDDLAPGGITLITHSGSVFSALLHNRRGLRFNLAVSSGLELVTSAGDYMDHALSQQSTQLIALFIEAARDPERFVAALRRAEHLDVPVVVLKVGRAARAKEMVQTHSGALAGEDGAYEAVFDAFGALRVETLDEMADTLELFVSGRRAAPGGLATIHDSGGERAHLVDLAEATRVPLAEISEATKRALASFLEEGLEPANPLDAWGTGNDADAIFKQCMQALSEDPGTGACALCVDLTTDPAPDGGYKQVATDVFAKTTKPFAVLSNMGAAVDAADASVVRGAGIPVLEGTATGLAAFGHLFAYRDHRARPPLDRPPPAPAVVRQRWFERLAGEEFDEVAGLALLSDYGIPVVRAERATSEEQVVDALGRVGLPAVLKTARSGVRHKSDVDGVRLDLQSESAVRHAYRDIAGRLGQDVTVAAAVAPGVELALGVIVDEQFGPLVMVAAGGTLIEVRPDRRLALPPVDRVRALAMVDHLSLRPLMDGVRGSRPVDFEAVALAIVRMSVLATELGERLVALDANPVICGPGGCVVVDALVIPRRPA